MREQPARDFDPSHSLFSQDINNRKNAAFFALRDQYLKGKTQYMALKEELAKWRGIVLPVSLF